MKLQVIVQYRRKSNKRFPLANYKLHGHRNKSGEPIVTGILITADPILRRNPRLANAIFKHEKDEAIARSKGLSLVKAHKLAKSKEPVCLKGKSHKQIIKALKSQA